MLKLSHMSSESIMKAVSDSISLKAAMRLLGLRVSGSTSQRFKDKVVSLGLDTSHFRHANTGVSPRNIKSAVSVFEERNGRARTPQLRRALKEHGLPYLCAECRQGPIWNGKLLVLQVDHKDGDRRNNDVSNLRWLCPNCHTQTPTFAMAEGTKRGHGYNRYTNGILFSMKEAVEAGLLSKNDLSIFLSKTATTRSRKTGDGRRLSEEEKTAIISLNKDGFNKSELSRRFGKDWATIHNILEKAKKHENAHDGFRASARDR